MSAPGWELRRLRRLEAAITLQQERFVDATEGEDHENELALLSAAQWHRDQIRDRLHRMIARGMETTWPQPDTPAIGACAPWFEVRQ